MGHQMEQDVYVSYINPLFKVLHLFLKISLKQKLLDENSIIVCPTFCKPALYHGELPAYGSGSSYLLLANIFGLPAIHIPLGLHKSLGIPIGAQVIAGSRRDHICLGVAQEMEMKFGGWKPPK